MRFPDCVLCRSGKLRESRRTPMRYMGIINLGRKAVEVFYCPRCDREPA